MVDASPCISFDPTNLSQVDGCLKYEPREAFQDNEALQSTPMVMSGPHSFGLSSGLTSLLAQIFSHQVHLTHILCMVLIWYATFH
jgi:hypothetical protein